MKGIILNLVEDAIVRADGADAWDDLVDRAGVHGAYTALGNYADDDLTKLVKAGSDSSGVTPADMTRQLGREALLGLAHRYPHFFEPHTECRSFVLTLNSVIHAEVRKLHPDADPPDFWFADPQAEPLVLHYQSQRQLCALAEGMLDGAASYFGEALDLEHEGCMLDGEEHCTMRVSFEKAS